MLSDEEKKAVDELKKEINNPVEVPTDKFNTFILYNIESARTIKNLIEKQSKEIEELKLRNEALGDITLYNQKNNDKKWEDKIKAKIEEYKWAVESYYCDEADYKQSQAVGAWNVLRLLLKESEI